MTDLDRFQFEDISFTPPKKNLWFFFGTSCQEYQKHDETNKRNRTDFQHDASRQVFDIFVCVFNVKLYPFEDI